MSILSHLVEYSCLNQYVKHERSNSTFSRITDDTCLQKCRKAISKSLSKINLANNIDPKLKIFHKIFHTLNMKCKKQYFQFFVNLETIWKNNKQKVKIQKQKKIQYIPHLEQTIKIIFLKLYERSIKNQAFKAIKLASHNNILISKFNNSVKKMHQILLKRQFISKLTALNKNSMKGQIMYFAIDSILNNQSSEVLLRQCYTDILLFSNQKRKLDFNKNNHNNGTQISKSLICCSEQLKCCRVKVYLNQQSYKLTIDIEVKPKQCSKLHVNNLVDEMGDIYDKNSIFLELKSVVNENVDMIGVTQQKKQQQKQMNLQRRSSSKIQKSPPIFSTFIKQMMEVEPNNFKNAFISERQENNFPKYSCESNRKLEQVDFKSTKKKTNCKQYLQTHKIMQNLLKQKQCKISQVESRKLIPFKLMNKGVEGISKQKKIEIFDLQNWKNRPQPQISSKIQSDAKKNQNRWSGIKISKYIMTECQLTDRSLGNRKRGCNDFMRFKTGKDAQ